MTHLKRLFDSLNYIITLFKKKLPKVIKIELENSCIQFLKKVLSY